MRPVVFQPTKHEPELEHVLTVVPFAIRDILEILADGAVALAENKTLEPLTVAPDFGEAIVIVGDTL